ncbi:GNAT family N-acetyltransferase [Brevundimonas sp.]|uniref:GNAT family N-acetyltransferase n=1 Tax=Brevundimonas sp. TaxID=1871086 RepID=UPI002D328721|nr:GNAT family N-acetyltransferase [Brevundimonas sp.]HYC74404.1 GNAT family N-acetyltransferase [Brevundimonas sp.]
MNTERLRIRPLRAADAEAVHEIHELVGHGRARRTLDQLRALYSEMEARPDEAAGWHGLVVELGDGVVIGEIGVCVGHPEEKQAELGYSLHPRFWRQGYATEALTAVLFDLFSRRRLHRVVATTAADNVASRDLLARLGFRLEARNRSAFHDYRLERWVDSVGYGLLASEWPRADPAGGPAARS